MEPATAQQRIYDGRALFHGGLPGMRVGDTVEPDRMTHRHVEGCAFCAAQAEGSALADPATPAGWVYACNDKPYARFYASRAVLGTLYRVRLVGDVEPSLEDPPWAWAWRARSAVVLAVLENNVVLTMEERWRYFRRFGGTRPEFEAMVRDVLAQGRAQ